MTTKESEFMKRWRDSTYVAGPDDPIYSSGLTMSSVRLPTASASSTPPSTDGTDKTNSDSPKPDPMQGAADQYEAEGRRLAMAARKKAPSPRSATPKNNRTKKD